MTFKDLVKTAFGNLGRHKVRTALSAVGVMVGILTIVTMLSLGVGVQQEIIRVFKSSGLETVRIRPVTEERTSFNQFSEPKRTVLITPALVEEMRARDDVVEVRPHVFIPWAANVSLMIGEEMLRVSVGESSWGLSEPFTKPPELLMGEELANDVQGEIVVSKRVLESLGYEEQAAFGDLIGREVALVLKAPRGDTQAFPFRLVGVLDVTYGVDGPYFDANIAVADALALKAWWYNDPDILEHEGYDSLLVKTASMNDATQVVELLQERGFGVESLRMMLDTINKSMIILQTMLGSIGGLALFVASIGIANTMVMAVYERTREIGILKAIGASPGNIRLLFVAEAAFIGLLGGVVGTIGGWLLGLGLNEGILAYLNYQEIPISGTFFVVTGWLVTLALSFATIIGLLAGLYPAARAARLDPLEALRYE
ncbi:MAG: ABC transporter permease [Chloroflexota bacterium]|nr:ABC transporter permease [Chloroflexota bacterium]